MSDPASESRRSCRRLNTPVPRLALAIILGTGLLIPACDSEPSGTLYVPIVIDQRGGRGADGLAIADINSDGLLDIVSAWVGSSTVRAHLQSPDGIWLNETIALGDVVGSVEDVALGDLDRDGLVDVVAACESGRLTRISQNVNWTSATIASSHNVGCSSWIDVEIADLNGDEWPDLAAACKGDGWLSIFRNRAGVDGVLSFERFDIDQTTRRKSSAVLAFDMDGDGDLDLVSAARNEQVNSIAWYENPGSDAAFGTTWIKHGIGHLADTIWFDLGDIDADGDIDVAASSWDDGEYAWFQRPEDPRGSWTKFPIGETPGTKGAGISIADVDQDDVAEVIVGTYRDGQLVMFDRLQPTSFQWIKQTLASPGGRYDLVLTVDLVGDSRLEVASTINADKGGVVVYKAWP